MELTPFELAVVLSLTTTLVLVTAGMALLAINRHAALGRMREAERGFRDLYDNIHEGVFRTTLDGQMVAGNRALARLNGYDTEDEMTAAMRDIGGAWYVDPTRRAQIHNMLIENGGKVSGLVSEVYRYRTRERIWVEENTRLIRDPKSGKPRYYEGTVRDVSESVKRNEFQKRFEKIAAIFPGVLFKQRTRPDGTFSMPYASRGLKDLFGFDQEEFARDQGVFSRIVSPEDYQRVLDAYTHASRTLTPRDDEYRIRLADGTEKWVHTYATPEREADGSIVWYGFSTDITERKRSESRVFDLAYVDNLTGLPNRAAFREGLQSEMATSHKSGFWSALLFIDLDQFKVLNDTKGHHFGDLLLRGVGARLSPIFGNDDIVARLAGDEFVVLVNGLDLDVIAAEARARQLAERVHSALSVLPFLLDGFPFHTSASIGVAMFRGNRMSTDELLRRADMAMYEAKSSGRGGIAFFKSEMQQRLADDLELTTELRTALDGGALTLAFQPQVDEGGLCFSAEALLRWHHPTRGKVPPSVFIPLAERAGLGAQIDAFVLREACETLRAWELLPGFAHLSVAVNIGHQQLGASLTALVTDVLRATRANPERLVIEITERVMLDHLDEVDAALAALKELGVKVALDDFGTGYSSLAHLKRLPIDTLKIDRSFVADIETDQNDRVIVQTILNVARNLGIGAIAEGVETEMQALLLRRYGCHAFQGFLYGHPMPRRDFEDFVRAQSGADDHENVAVAR